MEPKKLNEAKQFWAHPVLGTILIGELNESTGLVDIWNEKRVNFQINKRELENLPTKELPSFEAVLLAIDLFLAEHLSQYNVEYEGTGIYDGENSYDPSRKISEALLEITTVGDKGNDNVFRIGIFIDHKLGSIHYFVEDDKSISDYIKGQYLYDNKTSVDEFWLNNSQNKHKETTTSGSPEHFDVAPETVDLLSDTSGSPGNNGRFSEIVKSWRDKLLPLDRKNKQLFFRPNDPKSRSIIKISDTSPDGIMDQFSVKTALLFDQAELKGISRTSEDLDDEAKVIQTKHDISGDCSPVELQHRLKNLRNRFREAQAEKGLNVLFLSMGLLNWSEQDGEEAHTPILLLPCRLEKRGPHEPFELSIIEDIPTINPMLNVAPALGLKLPEMLSQTEKPSDFFKKLRDEISSSPDWSIDESVYLSIFNYSKIGMWNDLNVLVHNGSTDNVLIAQLTGTERRESGAVKNDQENVTDPLEGYDSDRLQGAKLDDLLDIKDQFTVLDADFSQLIAINRAASGRNNMIIHGPPGTGKSQTIANIIATCLAHGKSVLFVSEKKAALEVVKKRLDECDIGQFCLEIHTTGSSGRKKSDIYDQLRSSMDSPRTIGRSEDQKTNLKRYRDLLNQHVRKLHGTYNPLDKTIYEIQGAFSKVQSSPNIDFLKDSLGFSLDGTLMAKIDEIVGRIRLRSREFKEHNDSLWHILPDAVRNFGLSDTIRADMLTIGNLIDSISPQILSLSNDLGSHSVTSIAELRDLKNRADHLINVFRVPKFWFEADISELKTISSNQADIQSEINGPLKQAKSVFGYPLPSLEFSDLASKIELHKDERKLLQDLFGPEFGQMAMKESTFIIKNLRNIENVIPELISTKDQLQDHLEYRAQNTWRSTQSLIKNSNFILSLQNLPHSWIDALQTDYSHEISHKDASNSAMQKLREKIISFQSECLALEELETQVLSRFDKEIVNVIDRETLIRYRTDHQNVWARVIPFLNSQYKNDSKKLRAFKSNDTNMTFDQETLNVELICRHNDSRNEWVSKEGELSILLGNKSQGRQTDWDSIIADFSNLQQSINESDVKISRILQIILTSELSSKAKELNSYLIVKSESFKNYLAEYSQKDILEKNDTTLNGLLDTVQKSKAILERIEEPIEICTNKTLQSVENLESLHKLLLSASRILVIEQGNERNNDLLPRMFEGFFDGVETDWSEVDRKIEWFDNLISLCGWQEVSAGLKTHLELPKDENYYKERHLQITKILETFDETIHGPSSLSIVYRVELSSLKSWIQANLTDIKKWSTIVSANADYAGYWLEYLQACRELDEVFEVEQHGPFYTTSLVRDKTDNSNELPDIISRQIYKYILDLIYKNDSDFENFSRLDQDERIKIFKELDDSFKLFNRNKVSEVVFSSYPDLGSVGVTSNNEIGILRSEINKKSKRLPVRTLFKRIPNVIHKLKPCVLMSPQAVSQYIPVAENESASALFDLVIFDEASQVLPEDAAPSFLRGKHVILAGDEQQLPPSSFWQRSSYDDSYYDSNDESDEDGDDAKDGFEGMESILGAAKSIIGSESFSETMLNVHYRSKNEELIAFSNHMFYKDNLITFPDNNKDDWNGLKDVYLPNGRYVTGKRSNPIEAKTIASMVIDHMRTRNESLGVVAMSRPQMAAIEDEIERIRLSERDIDAKFDQNIDEPFFVKNLENVQGDERDRMIMSVGYGPTAGSNAVYNRFGPINGESGKRRLNVAITRARKRMDIVHSLQASDIKPTGEGGSGAQILKRFLEYAASDNRAQFFEATTYIDPNAEPDSDFEQSVADALRNRGHKIQIQVGVSGYRIDMAIVSEVGNGYDLAIECDGATYHSSPSARDRDRVRQNVLEGLGWTIHRVWSTSWIQNPAHEIDLIEKSLKAARSKSESQILKIDSEHSKSMTTLSPMKSSTIEEYPKQDDVERVTVQTNKYQLRIDDYIHLFLEVQLTAEGEWKDLKAESTPHIKNLILKVVSSEGPVHINEIIDRLRIAYGLGSVRTSTRQQILNIIKSMVGRGEIVRDTDQFVWQESKQLKRMPRLPSTSGKIEHMYSGELESICIGLIRELLGIDRINLITEVTRRLKFQRTGATIRKTLNKIIDNLVRKKIIDEDSDGFLRKIK